jgi:2-polyprenyl-3-methyl-5-hydroxy-6-metoxy-1,4-benzoquinol methylase
MNNPSSPPADHPATPGTDTHQQAKEVAQGQRFEFGQNWSQFLEILNDDRIVQAETSLKDFLDVPDLHGKRFLDIGSGSGLFSLAARRLGASVHSFDYDPQSVACTQELKRRYFPDDADWRVEEGSALDEDYLKALGQFDVVYSWGVLHHTGAMWQALGNVAPLVAAGGTLYIAIYNDQGRASRQWTAIKKVYNRLPTRLKFLVLWPSFLRLWGPTILLDLMRGKPFRSWRHYGGVRGMSPWRDHVDWVGGYPFEVATPEAIFHFFRRRGFDLKQMTTCAGGHGCNEFAFASGQAEGSLR